MVTVSDKARLVSFEIAEPIVLQEKSHTIGESLILSGCSEIVILIFGTEEEKDKRFLFQTIQ